MPANTFNITINFNGHTIRSGESLSFAVVPGGSVTDADLVQSFNAAMAAAAAAATAVSYDAGTHTLTFGPGAVSPFVVPFTVNTDATSEGDEIFAVTITNQSAGKIAKNSATVVFRDTSTTVVPTIAVPSAPVINWFTNFSGGNIRENTPANTPVANLSATSTVAVTWALAGTTAFRLDGAQLVLNRAVTFAGEPSINFDLTPSNVSGAGTTLHATATIVATGSAPSTVSLSATTVPEKSAVNTVVGTISGTDPDVGDTLTFSIVSGSDPGGIFQIVSGNSLRIANANFTYAQGNRPVTIRATDVAGNIKDQAFVITVTDVNEAPTDITLSSTLGSPPQIPADAPADFFVGTFSAADPDPAQTIQYSFYSPASNFKIIGDKLYVSASPITPTGPLNLSVRATDQGTLSFDKLIPINVTPAGTVAPTAINVTWRTGFANGVIPDTTPSGTILADVVPNATSTLAIVTDADGKFAVNNAPSQALVLNNTLNAATKNNHTVVISATNTGGTLNKTIAVSVIAGSTALLGTPDATDPRFPFMPFTLPDANSTGYRGNLISPTSITTTNSGTNIYRDSVAIYVQGTSPVLAGYDLQGWQVLPQSANWTVRDCLMDAASGFFTLNIPNGAATAATGGTVIYCTFDGKKVNNNNHNAFVVFGNNDRQTRFSYNKMINVPSDGINWGGTIDFVTKNFFQGFGWQNGAHPDIMTCPGGYAGQPETIIAYNYMDCIGDGPVYPDAMNATIKIDDFSSTRGNFFIYRNLHKGGSYQHQMNVTVAHDIEFSENYRLIINGPPHYGPLGVGNPGWDGPYGAHYAGMYTNTNNIIEHDTIDVRDGLPAYELAGAGPPQNTQRSTQKIEKFQSGRPGQVTINSISSAGAFSIVIPTGSPTSYQYRTSIANTGEFGAWTTLTTSGSGPLTGTITLIANAWNHVLIRAVNGSGPGPVSKTYQIASATVTPVAPTIGSATITGTTTQGNNLTANANTVTGTPSPTLSYQWQRDVAGNGVWSNVGTNSNTYLLGSGDVGNKIRVIITAANGTLPNATATSSATALITGAAATISRRSLGTVAKSGISPTGGAQSCNPALPAGIVAGDLLLLFIECADATVLTAMAGWTLVGAYGYFGVGGCACYKRVATGSDTAPTVALSASRVGDEIIAVIACYTGGSCLVDASEFEFYTSSASATSTGNNRLPIYFIGAESQTSGTNTFVGGAVTNYSKILESNESATGYNNVLTIYEKTALVNSGAVTPAVPTYSPTTPTQLQAGGHGLILIY
jgi:hypothetical protein